MVEWASATEHGHMAVIPAGSRVIVEPTGGWLAVALAAEQAPAWTHLRFGYGDHHVQFDVNPRGTRVAITSTAGIPADYVQTLLFSTVMGYLLHRLGRLALHAGVVARGGAAFAIAGAQGAGKSTTVGALIQRGCTSMSDDVAVLTRTRQGWAVVPGITGIRLAPQAQAALGIPPEAATPLWPRSQPLPGVDYRRLEDKAVVTVDAAPDHRPGVDALPLAGVFLLPPRTDAVRSPRVTILPRTAAVPRLVALLSTPAWLARTVDEHRFATLADLARTTPVYVVERPDNLDALPQLCDALLGAMELQRR
ncbi:MAG: hypothetical protein ACRD12_17725 [Acidimicrobiales bacterium]